MQETRFQELRRYVAFTEEDAQRLLRFRVVAEPHFHRIAQEFYERIREHEEAHAVFTGEDQIARLQKSLVRWMHRLCGGTYDERYYEDTATIGRVHVKVGLPQRYMFTSMAVIRSSLMAIAERELPREESFPLRDALSRLLDIELAIMLESYKDDFIARLRHVERLELEELGRSLARAERRYVHAVELSRVLIVGLDAQKRVCLFNGEAERVAGFDRDEVLRQPFEMLLPEETRDLHFKALQDVAAGGRGPDDAVDGFLRTKSGRVRSVRWRFVPAPAMPHDEVAFFVTGVDITDERAMQEQSQQHEKLAAVGTLAAGLAHEIRNPLNGAQLHVSYLARALKRSNAEGDLLETVNVIDDEIKRLAVLVTEFLDFARPKPLTVKALSLNALCERCVHLVTPQAQECQADLRLDLPTNDITLEGDGSKLEQVLLNLLRNAIEAVPASGGGHVVLRARRQPRTAVLEVEDDGPGIENPDAPIFDAFFSTKAQGTGLGLSITHRIVTDHGGSIQVESRPGRTVFKVTLPLERSVRTAAIAERIQES